MFKKLKPPIFEHEITKHWKYTDKIYISVVCTTYNQEHYIRDAIESFLAQETDYKFEIIIHDDASTDNTANIVSEYAKKYPSIIKPIFQDENQYSFFPCKPSFNCFEVARGDYICICEGDDYWINSKKLQMQISKLIFDDEISLVHSAFVSQNENELQRFDLPIDTSSLLRVNTVGTLTVMLRKEDLLNYMQLVRGDAEHWLLGDWPLWIYLSTVGKRYKINDTLACYRILAESASHFKDESRRFNFRMSTFEIRSYFFYTYGCTLKDKIIFIMSLSKSVLIGSLKFKKSLPIINRVIRNILRFK